MKSMFFRITMSLAFVCWAGLAPSSAQSNAHSGLWVGDVLLGEVNEVTVPLDDQNVPRAPDPNVVTPTSDAASLRLILHVDAAGRVSLLKHVAILARKAGVQESESDLALVTDERLYGVFPPQPATRISSVAFDFGDAKATAAVNEVVGRAATAAATAAQVAGATQATVAAAAEAAAGPVVAEADATAAFTSFLQDHLDAVDVRAIANGGPTTAARTEATNLRNSSFYRDERGLEMLDAIEAVIAGLPGSATTDEREQAALNTAAAFAETDLASDRFLAGEMIGDAIAAAADSAAATAAGLNWTPVTSFDSSEGGASVAVVSAAHGLSSGDEVAIQGAAVGVYNALHVAVRIDDDSFRIAVPHVIGGPIAGYSASTGVAPLQVTSVAHGLGSGDLVRIRESLAAYNGRHLVTVVDADTFTIDVPFESDPPARGVWFSQSGEIISYEGVDGGAAGVKVTAPGHGLDNGEVIEISGAGSASYNGLKTITRIDDDSFLLDQAFAGNPAEMGSWDLPVEISGFAPPATLSVLVDAAGHGLASGDRVAISGSGKAEYNAEFTVTVVDAGSFSIPVEFDPSTGNPGVAGSWLPAAGGQWKDAGPVRDGLDLVDKVDETRAEALRVDIDAYDDTRSADAFQLVIDAIVAAATLSDSGLTVQVATVATAAGREVLATSVTRYPRPSTVPSLDYDNFVRSQEFADGVATASAAAAEAALDEKTELLATPTSIRDKALGAAIDSLAAVFAFASRSLLPELAMSGAFGPAGGVDTELILPANHPTNPFRHRRHPDHTVGFDIRRMINLSFDAADRQPLGRAGYGVDRISGVYEEEIFGLHKPLGPDKDIGLKVRGHFQLNRISQIDTLNGL